MANYSYRFRKFRKKMKTMGVWEEFKEEYYKYTNNEPLTKLDSTPKRWKIPYYLMSAFLWYGSNKGYLYWSKVFNKLCSLNR